MIAGLAVGLPGHSFAFASSGATGALQTGSAPMVASPNGPVIATPAPLASPVAATSTTPDAAVATPDVAGGPESLKMAPDPTQRLRLSVMVNGQGPYDFLIDTGSDRTVISRELADALNLKLGPHVIMHESAGVDNIQTAIIDKLEIGNRRISHIEAPEVPAASLGAAGMLGVDALRNLHIVMDFKAMRLSSSESRREPTEAGTIVVHGRSRFGQLVLVDAEVRGVPVFVVLDSGSQLSVGNPALLRLLTGHVLKPESRHEAEIISVTGRKMTVELDDITEAHIGGLEIRNMPLAFAQLHTFDRFGLVDQPALLLGMDVLRQCQRVSVDLRRKEATFTLN
ncbi:retroviral-like aspartic protease family protein [Phenylobacterium montanum]|uniref:Retroviral-like aspartic protease family protein n=1 Tax=Phenylobacterium montanum TaxID=2823693 RepID=A0A975G0A6_9CAUL|nr:retroviral-like aspartic protease family protein [Caulobacter sp. S6]QUD88122.1 retroviral-like aspartic protease family protein [Caulobacter sp. S6]